MMSVGEVEISAVLIVVGLEIKAWEIGHFIRGISALPIAQRYKQQPHKREHGRKVGVKLLV